MDGVVSSPQSALPQAELDRITDDLVTQFKTVFDPEIPVDVYELGLIYKVDINDEGFVDSDMKLTAPVRPVAGRRGRVAGNARAGEASSWARNSAGVCDGSGGTPSAAAPSSKRA